MDDNTELENNTLYKEISYDLDYNKGNNIIDNKNQDILGEILKKKMKTI